MSKTADTSSLNFYSAGGQGGFVRLRGAGPAAICRFGLQPAAVEPPRAPWASISVHSQPASLSEAEAMFWIRGGIAWSGGNGWWWTLELPPALCLGFHLPQPRSGSYGGDGDGGCSRLLPRWESQSHFRPCGCAGLTTLSLFPDLRRMDCFNCVKTDGPNLQNGRVQADPAALMSAFGS